MLLPGLLVMILYAGEPFPDSLGVSLADGNRLITNRDSIKGLCA